MRVIAGDYKGRNLKAPQGSNTRPTTDRVRESLFSTLASARGGFEDAVVLDAFAGSGALGIEALSRGAAFAVFCEQDRAALQALQSNLEFVDASRVSLVVGDVTKRTPRASQPFDLLFFDPPYAFSVETVIQILESLEAAGALARGALISYEFGTSESSAQGKRSKGSKAARQDECARDQVLDAPLIGEHNPLGLEYVTRKSFGSTAIDIHRKV